MPGTVSASGRRLDRSALGPRTAPLLTLCPADCAAPDPVSGGRLVGLALSVDESGGCVTYGRDQVSRSRDQSPAAMRSGLSRIIGGLAPPLSSTSCAGQQRARGSAERSGVD